MRSAWWVTHICQKLYVKHNSRKRVGIFLTLKEYKVKRAPEDCHESLRDRFDSFSFLNKEVDLKGASQCCVSFQSTPMVLFLIVYKMWAILVILTDFYGTKNIRDLTDKSWVSLKTKMSLGKFSTSWKKKRPFFFFFFFYWVVVELSVVPVTSSSCPNIDDIKLFKCL